MGSVLDYSLCRKKEQVGEWGAMKEEHQYASLHPPLNYTLALEHSAFCSLTARSRSRETMVGSPGRKPTPSSYPAGDQAERPVEVKDCGWQALGSWLFASDEGAGDEKEN